MEAVCRLLERVSNFGEFVFLDAAHTCESNDFFQCFICALQTCLQVFMTDTPRFLFAHVIVGQGSKRVENAWLDLAFIAGETVNLELRCCSLKNTNIKCYSTPQLRGPTLSESCGETIEISFAINGRGLFGRGFCW